jgi:NAD(P)-dependent dehydrogenase (short-subunit alcohol dehydrogenase family)
MNKVWLVTGSARGLGRNIAEAAGAVGQTRKMDNLKQSDR